MIKKISQGMSDRSYFRVSENGQSYIVSQTNINQKQSFSNLLNIHSYLESNNIPVPEIYLVDLKNQIIWQQDAGQTLLDYIKENKLSFTELELLYKKIINILINIQLLEKSKCVAFRKNFSYEKIQTEYQHLIKPMIDDKLLENYYSKIAANMAKSPRVFCLRDFQSTNILINNDNKKLVIVDFQDARLALPQYDLVSLLEDNYIDLPPKLKGTLKNYYLKEYSKKSGQAVNKEEFLEFYQAALIQRKLHDWAIFVNAYHNSKKRKYLRYIEKINKVLSYDKIFDSLKTVNLL